MSNQEIRLLALDLDGVLTDGRLWFAASGEPMKCFHARDGYGIRRAQEAGITVAVISGRADSAGERRAAELGIRHCVFGCHDKGQALAALQATLAIGPEQTAAVGDDLIDLGLFAHAALRIAVADAHLDLATEADWVTSLGGGYGAVREVCDALLAGRLPDAGS